MTQTGKFGSRFDDFIRRVSVIRYGSQAIIKKENYRYSHRDGELFLTQDEWEWLKAAVEREMAEPWYGICLAD